MIKTKTKRHQAAAMNVLETFPGTRNNKGLFLFHMTIELYGPEAVHLQRHEYFSEMGKKYAEDDSLLRARRSIFEQMASDRQSFNNDPHIVPNRQRNKVKADEVRKERQDVKAMGSKITGS